MVGAMAGVSHLSMASEPIAIRVAFRYMPRSPRQQRAVRGGSATSSTPPSAQQGRNAADMIGMAMRDKKMRQPDAPPPRRAPSLPPHPAHRWR